jgi:hypothetical protein
MLVLTAVIPLPGKRLNWRLVEHAGCSRCHRFIAFEALRK